MMKFIEKHKFIAILRHIPKDKASEVAKAMYDGGVRIFEVTFNPSSKDTISETTSIIRIISELFGDEACVGAGTVINLDFAKAAHDAGAKFLVSPGTKESVVRFAKENGMLAIPGAYTPTEIMNAYDMGADIVKVFPVAPSEAGYLKNVMSPLSHIPFIPTGGINPDTIDEFMNTGAIALAAGATIASKALAESGDFDTIRENARSHIEKIEKYKLD